MFEERTLPSSKINISFIFNIGNNTSLIDNNNNNSSSNHSAVNGTNAQDGNGLDLALYALPQIPSWVSALYFSMLCLSILIGVPGNALTVAAYARIRTKTNCDWYILIVALTDLVSCLFRSPVYILEYRGVWLLYSNSHLCRLISWLSQTTVCVSIFMFALIAIDRYIKLCHTFKWNISPIKARNVSLLVVVLNLVIASPCLFIFENLTRGVCKVKEAMMGNVLIKGYYSLIFVLFLMMFIAVVFCYINIAYKVQNARRVGDVSAPHTTHILLAVRPAEDGQLPWNRQDQSLKTVEGRTMLPCKTETPAGASTSLTTTRHHLALLDIDRPGRKMTTSLASKFDHANVSSNSNKAPTSAAQKHSVFAPLGEQAAPNEGHRQHNQTSVWFSKVSNQRLHQDMDSNGGGNLLNNEFDPSRLPGCSTVTTQTRQEGAHDAEKALTEMNRRRALMRQQRNIRITGLLFVVTAVFIISWLPPYISLVKGLYVGYSPPFSLSERLLFSYGRSFYVLNTFSNPIVYAALSATYRGHIVALAKALWEALCHIRCCG